MGKTMHFPCDEVYPTMGVEWEKSTHTMGKVWKPISIAFSCATGKFMGKPMRFPCDEVYHRMGIALEKSTHKSSPHQMDFVAFSHSMDN